MSIDDSMEDDENNGNVLGGGNTNFFFPSREARDRFFDILIRARKNAMLIEEEGYKCKDCAAFPCFRGTNPDDCGLCFQPVRQCRQECDYFRQDENSGAAPHYQITGTCARDSSKVNYRQECHIPEMRKQRSAEVAIPDSM